jgi:hypothetical protein
MSSPLAIDSDESFPGSMDSATDPIYLPKGSFAWSVNMLNRDGALRTRPGYRWMFSLPAGKLQGFSFFSSQAGKPVLVAFVSGTGYAANYPYNSFRRIQGARMSSTADYVYTERAVQSVTNNADGSLRLIQPRNLLMVQDGVNPPAYFDGRILTALTGNGVTPQGTHMKWAGSRLWVARGPQIFASDIANPTSFLEQTYNTLGGINYFLLSDNCTGLAAVPGAPQALTPLLAFTASDTTTFQSNILNRALWPSVTNFQYTTFPTLGCVAPRSLAVVSGELWWFSELGTTRLDAAQASQLTTRIYRIDREMGRSMAQLKNDLSGICAVTYENFALFSVPNSSRRNTHTWVYDGSVNDRSKENASAWAGVWTGVSPVEWVKIKVNGKTRVFCASVDADGVNRVYETFTPDRRDNGCDFPWVWDSRGYTGGALTRKHLRFLEYSLSEIQGSVNLKVSWAGTGRGRWKTLATPVYCAAEGNARASRKYGPTSKFYALKKQSRIARTQDVRNMREDTLSSAGVEGVVETVEANKEAVDVGFQFRFEGSGPCAIRAVRIFADVEKEPASGQKASQETGEHFVRFDGAASKVESDLDAPPERFSATGTGRAQWNNFAAQATASVNGTISAADSLKRSKQIAQRRSENRLRAISTPYVAKGSV